MLKIPFNSDGGLHANLLIKKRYFRSLSFINTAPISVVLRIDIPTQMEPTFFSKQCKFWLK